MNKTIIKRGNDFEVIENKKCPFCKRDITEFTDLVSKREYEISGLCQKCQDDFFDTAY